jgi:hypothetical protein
MREVASASKARMTITLKSLKTRTLRDNIHIQPHLIWSVSSEVMKIYARYLSPYKDWFPFREHWKLATVCQSRNTISACVRLLEPFKYRSCNDLSNSSSPVMFLSFSSFSERNAVELGCNIMKGTEYFVSL